MKILKTVRQHWVCETFWTKEGVGEGHRMLVSVVGVGGLQVVEEEGTMGHKGPDIKPTGPGLKPSAHHT